MRLPDVIVELKALDEKVKALQAEVDFHHAQFRGCARELRRLVLLLPGKEGAHSEPFELAIIDLCAQLQPLIGENPHEAPSTHEAS